MLYNNVICIFLMVISLIQQGAQDATVVLNCGSQSYKVQGNCRFKSEQAVNGVQTSPETAVNRAAYNLSLKPH